MIGLDSRIGQLVEQYSDPQACVAQLLCDNHPSEQSAFRIVDPDLSTRDLRNGQLRQKSERFAAGLSRLGVDRGDSVGVLMGKSEELIVALLAIWRLGAIHVPLFTAFAPAAIALRLSASEAKVVISDADQRSKLDPSDDMPQDSPWLIVTTGATGDNDFAFQDLLSHEEGIEPAVVGGDGTFIIIFTSGTTGTPKGVPVQVKALAHLVAYMEYGIDLRPSDVYWNAADPGWAYGLYYAITAPLAMGRSSILLHAGFSAQLTWRVLRDLNVTNFAAAPTVYRSLRQDVAGLRLSLRCASSAGEPLSPDLIPWGEATLGVPIRDHYGQTELGMVVVNGWHPGVRRDIKPGSMGYTLPGHNVAILREDRDEPAATGELGRVAIDTTTPLFTFPGYYKADDRTRERLSNDGNWYLTGDTALMDDAGALFFSSRDDDVIIMAGYRIGPFEIESVLVAHPDVCEAAVIGAPDELRGEVVEAFVVLGSGAAPSEELTRELKQLVKTKFAAHAYPRAIHYMDALPKTPSGKLQRYILRAQRQKDRGQ